MLRPMTPPAPDVASIASSVFLEFLVSYQFLFMGEIVHSTEPTQYPSSYLPSPEQGRRNDLSRDAAVRKNSSSVVAMSNNIRPTDIHHLSPPVPFISDSVHCSPLNQFSAGSNGRSCHTDVKLSVELDNVTSGVVPTRQSSAPSWVHVFSKSSSPSSLRTQIAAAAHLDATSPKVFHRRFRRAKRKRKKTKGLLEEVFLPANLFTLSSELIDREIIVFDGGNPHTPPIKPPYGVHWQSLSVRRLHIQDNIEPNIGLTAPRMCYDISPFIRLPRQIGVVHANVGQNVTRAGPSFSFFVPKATYDNLVTSREESHNTHQPAKLAKTPRPWWLSCPPLQ